MIIKEYNELINKYNHLIKKKNIGQNKRVNSESINKSISLLTNSNNKLRGNSKPKIINDSKNRVYNSINLNIIRKNKKFSHNKHILIQKNNKNINITDNDYDANIRKEKNILKKLIKTYKNINFNNFKKPINNLKERNYFINNRIIGKSYQNNSISKDNSKDQSFLIKSINERNSKNKCNSFNKSQILFPMKTSHNTKNKNNFMDYSYTNDSSVIFTNKNKLSSENPDYKNFNTININNYNLNNVIKKYNTYVKSISGSLNKNNISNQKKSNKLKVKCRNYFLNDKIISIDSNNNLSNDKNNKLTPKNIIKNNVSFFANSNYNIKKKFKNKNKLKSFQKINLDNQFINSNNNDIQNNTETNYYNNYNIEKKKNEISRINTESKNNTINKNLIIHRNTVHKMGNRFRLIKEFKTETEKFYINLKKEIFSGEKEVATNNLQKIKINRKNIFFKKSQNSLMSALNSINPTLNEISDNLINSIRTNNKPQFINNTAIIKSNRNKLVLNNKKINNNLLNINCKIKDKKNQKQLHLYSNKKPNEKTARMSILRNNKMKALNNTINNVSNFNNCNYICLFNNGEKFVKNNKQFKI